MIILLAGTCLIWAVVGASVCYAVMAGKYRAMSDLAADYRDLFEAPLPLAEIGLARKRAIERQNAKRKAERAGRVK